MAAQVEGTVDAVDAPGVIEAVDAVADKVNNVEGDKVQPNDVEVAEADFVNTAKELTKDKHTSAVKDIEDRANGKSPTSQPEQ
jgi:hypothetical protein